MKKTRRALALSLTLSLGALLTLTAPVITQARAQGGYSSSAGVPAVDGTVNNPAANPVAALPAVSPPPEGVAQGYNQALQQLQQIQAQQQIASPPQYQMQQQAVTVAPATDPATPPDPCAAYQTQDGYTLCQDRLRKLDRMQNYRAGQIKAREDREKARLDAIAAKNAAGKTAVQPVEQAIGAPANFAPVPTTPAATADPAKKEAAAPAK